MLNKIKNLIINSVPFSNFENYLDKLQLGYKDKVIIVLGETGVGKSTFINEITQSSECKSSSKSISCTQEVKIVKLYSSGFNLYFIDTPGLNDSKGDINHIQLLQNISKKGIITTIILVHNYTKIRLSESDEKILETFMTIFPSQNFWEHVLFVQSFYFPGIIKDSLIESIKDNKDLIKYMTDNEIIIPNEIKTYFINFGDGYKTNKDTFDDIIENIKDMHPFYKRYKEEENFKINETKDINGICYINYEHHKYIEYINFEGLKFKKDEIIDSGRYLSKNIKPEQVIIEREPLDEYRNSFWFFCPPERHINYWEIKQYNFNNNIYEIKTFKNETWERETEKKDGETLRKKMEKEINRAIGIKS